MPSKKPPNSGDRGANGSTRFTRRRTVSTDLAEGDAASRASHRFNNDLRYRENGHENQRQLSPPYVLEPVLAALGDIIGLDPCTEPDNPTGAMSFFTVADDGLVQPWHARHWLPSVYVNPPYSKARERWVI